MSDHNRISATLSAEDLAAVMAALKTIESKLPFLVNLEPGEIQELPRLGPKTLHFDQGCATYMAANPEFLPAYVLMREVDKDRVVRGQLADVSRVLGGLAKSVEDTLAVVSHEIYNADLAFYQNVKQAAKRGVLKADAAYADLSARFPGRSAASVAAQKNAGTPVVAAAN